MAKENEKDYNSIDVPYGNLLYRENNLNFNLQGQSTGPMDGDDNYDGAAEKKTGGGTVTRVTLKSDGNATDIWIRNFIRSSNWKPKSVGFYINGRTGYAEFTDIFVSGQINAVSGILGGFEIGPNYIRDVANSMGLSSVQTPGDDVRFWAGTTFDDRDNAPFRVYESGSIYAQAGILGGFEIGPDYIRDSADTTGIATTVTGGDDVRFWAGIDFANRDTAPFRVYESGLIVADNVQINGGNIENVFVAALSGTQDPEDELGPPTILGQLYIRTTNETAWISVSTAAETGWRRILLAELPARQISKVENITVTDVQTVGSPA